MARQHIISVKRGLSAPEQLRPDGRADPIRTNHGICLNLAAVRNPGNRAAVVRIGADAGRLQPDGSFRQSIPQQPLNMRAMRRHVGSAVALGRDRL